MKKQNKNKGKNENSNFSNKKLKNCGALWLNNNENSKTVSSGYIDPEIFGSLVGKVQIKVFKNERKSANDKRPDFRIVCVIENN